MFSVAKPFRQRYILLSAAGISIGVASLYLFIPDKSRSAPSAKHTALSASHFTPCTVTSSVSTSHDTKLIKLKIPPECVPRHGIPSIWSVFIKDDDIQVERPYTPLEGLDGDREMSFWIKKYPSGEVGRWLHAKQVGEEVELRGPLQTWEWKENTWDEVVMISAGTGITPFYQLFDQVISQKTRQDTRFTLLHSSKSIQDFPPESIMTRLVSFSDEYPDTFRIQLFADEVTTAYSLRPVAKGRIDKKAIEETLKQVTTPWWKLSAVPNLPPKRILFLVCGPEPMITAIAGSYGRNFSQGPVGGFLKDMGYQANQIYKL